MNNKNLLTRKRGGFDELYTPPYAVEVLKEYIPKGTKRILCPFDDFSTSYVKVLSKLGYEVDYSHHWDGKDFFDYTKEEVEKYDVIISNPPYSIKNKVLKHLYKLNKPFAMLLPISTLEGIERGKMFSENGIEILVLNRRINFMEESGGKASYFNTSYFCWKLLGKQMIFKDMKK